MLRILSFLMTLVILSAYALAGTSIFGKVTGSEGKPMLLANVFLNHPNDDHIITSVAAQKDGKFRIMIDSKGIWILRFTGVYHRQYRVALYIDTQKSINLNVKLEPYIYREGFKNARVTGSFNNWNLRYAVPMKEERNGTYSAVVENKSDTLAYRLINVGVESDVEGTEANRFASDTKGCYNSLLIGKKGKVKIIFDPRKLVRFSERTSFAFTPSDSLESRFSAAYSILEDIRYQISSLSVAHNRGSGIDFTAIIDSVKNLCKNEPNELIRQALTLSYFGLNDIRAHSEDVDYHVCRETLDEIPPNSIVWSLEPLYISDVLKLPVFRSERPEYIHKVLETNPVEQMKAGLLLNEIVRNNAMFRPLSETLPYLEILLDQYGDSPEAIHERERSLSSFRIKEGAKAPAFSAASLLDSSMHFTNDSFKDKYYLLDFWSTKNKASVDEINNIQKAYKKYNNKNFVILSLSLDSLLQNVVNFRQGANKMPWFNTLVDDGFESNICKDFEIYSIPKAILVDPNGNIAAAGWNLRGDNFYKTLEKYLGK